MRQAVLQLGCTVLGSVLVPLGMSILIGVVPEAVCEGLFGDKTSVLLALILGPPLGSAIGYAVAVWPCGRGTILGLLAIAILVGPPAVFDLLLITLDVTSHHGGESIALPIAAVVVGSSALTFVAGNMILYRSYAGVR